MRRTTRSSTRRSTLRCRTIRRMERRCNAARRRPRRTTTTPATVAAAVAAAAAAAATATPTRPRVARRRFQATATVGTPARRLHRTATMGIGTSTAALMAGRSKLWATRRQVRMRASGGEPRGACRVPVLATC